MKLNPDGLKPIYVQIAEWIENEILSGKIESDGKVYSQYQLAEMFNINPATAAKGLNVLADTNILYKKRGLGMFVKKDAKAFILSKRKEETLRYMVDDLVEEAVKLRVNEDELLTMIKKTYEQKVLR
ncbi:MAG: GntR family transcriptional regulator [Bacillaceae bacterium]|nr:GntR family transcriptional regulator [Bacillaceae bacterium]